MVNEPLAASAFVVIKGTRTRYGMPDPVTGLRPVRLVKVSRVTQSPPRNLAADELVAKVAFSVSPALFDPVIPEMSVELFDEAVQRGTIVITAEGEGDS